MIRHYRRLRGFFRRTLLVRFCVFFYTRCRTFQGSGSALFRALPRPFRLVGAELHTLYSIGVDDILEVNCFYSPYKGR